MENDQPKKKTRGKAPELLTLVSFRNRIPENYKPQLVSVEGGWKIDCRCSRHLEQMLKDCRAAGGCPCMTSGYRSAERQSKLFREQTAHFMKYYGLERSMARGAAVWYVAPPHASEHELGLAADISDDSEGELTVNNSFTARWLEDNAWKYGFILRYPKGKEKITGVMYEPWHFRYVGIQYAGEIHRLGVTLEEYLALYYT